MLGDECTNLVLWNLLLASGLRLVLDEVLVSMSSVARRPSEERATNDGHKSEVEGAGKEARNSPASFNLVPPGV